MKLTETQLAQIDTYLAAHRGEIVQTLMGLIRIPSVKSEPEPHAPFGENCAAALEAAHKLYEREGLETKKTDSYALASYGSGTHTLGVFAHADVVPVNAADWTVCAPFEPVVRDGFVYGRGSDDNKSGIVASLYAVKMLRELELPFDGKLMLYIGSNEESGMADIAEFVKNEPMPDISLVPDGGYPFSYGEKSILRLYLTSKTAFREVIDITGGKAVNMVLDQVEAQIADKPGLWDELIRITADDDRITADRAGDRITVTATGVAAHAAHPADGVNALDILAEVLGKCQSLCENDRAVFGRISALLADCNGASLGVPLTDPAFGALTAANGVVRTESGKLSLSFDVRFGNSSTCQDVLAAIKQHTSDHWEVQNVRATDGFLLDVNGETPMKILDVYRTVSGQTDAAPFLMGGGTYARHLKNAYSVGTVAWYKCKNPVLPKGHGGAHQSDEFLCIDAFLEAIKILTATIVECGEKA
ncbi:MAG: Sapep family Mn(2+)-dependent dipeptidase [Eubacteriales bacterium]|jgi:succinyl-diaminopimelate desuccinylase